MFRYAQHDNVPMQQLEVRNRTHTNENRTSRVRLKSHSNILMTMRLRELCAQHPQRFLQLGEIVVRKSSGYRIACARGSL